MTKLLEISDWTVTILSLLNIYIISYKVFSDSDTTIFFLQTGYSFMTILLYWTVRSILKSNINNLSNKKTDYENKERDYENRLKKIGAHKIEARKIEAQNFEKLKQEKKEFLSKYPTEYNKLESNMKAFNISMLSLTALPYLLSVIMKLYIKFRNKKQK
jgi:hypothetical protein